jgi:hypothetical protein
MSAARACIAAVYMDGAQVSSVHICPGSSPQCRRLSWLGRERQPWEAADGAVYLVRELAAAAPDTMQQLLPALADAVRHSHYAHACHLQASNDPRAMSAVKVQTNMRGLDRLACESRAPRRA